MSFETVCPDIKLKQSIAKHAHFIREVRLDAQVLLLEVIKIAHAHFVLPFVGECVFCGVIQSLESGLHILQDRFIVDLGPFDLLDSFIVFMALMLN